MTAAEAMTASVAAGITLGLGSDGQLVITADRGRLAPAIKAALLDHRDRLVAALKLREIHRAMGHTEEDVLFVEEALLSGRINEIRIVVHAPAGAPA